jgi:hypothetical protein
MAERVDNINAAKRTYGSFIGMIKWSVPVLAVLVLIVILLIS